MMLYPTQPSVKSASLVSAESDTVSLTMPDDAIPNTAKCEVSVIGSLLGPVASADLDLEGDAFLNIPRGCGEQTLIYTAPNVYIYKYLKALQQDTPETEKKAIDYMEQGYSREINHYHTNDGAFKTFANTPGNSWLTALALRIFCQASEFIEVDEKGVICKAISWLQTIQKQDGSFGFTADTRHGSHFMGGIDENEPIPLTAFILIALSECTCSEMDTTLTKSKATQFLEGKLPDIGQDAHTLAIVTYALALVDSARKDDANTQLKALSIDDAAQGTKHFGAQAGGAVTVETTAYALLAQIHLAQVSYSFPIVQWLMQQRNQIGNWYSTQDTMVSLQALSEYAAVAHTGDIDMHCDVTSTVDATFLPRWDITPENALVLQATQAPVEGELLFQSRGTGVASLSVNLHYHKASGDGSCPFDVDITTSDDVEKVKAGAPPGAKQKKKKLKLQVCAKYTGEGTTNMAIIDVGLLSGFVPVTQSLKEVTEGSDVIQFFEVTDRNVIFYADSIPKGDDTVEPLCVEFEAVQDFEVSNVQPVPVKVYDYYLPERKCTKFYRPDGGSPLLETICHGDACTCSAASCLNIDPTVQLQSSKLKGLACKTVEHFAYKTSFVLKELKDTFEVFHMTVTPLKRGSDQDVQNSQQCQFWKSRNCEQPMLEDGNDYLIVGKGGLPVKDQNNIITEYRHFIDSDFTIIPWPREDQFRDEEKKCKNACPIDANNNKCKVECHRTHRPGENTRREYFRKVEEEFVRGCSL